MAKLVLTETVSTQLDDMPFLDGRLTWTSDTKCLYRDTDTERVLISSGVVKLGHKLTFTGGATGTFDGNEDLSIEIPTVHDSTVIIKQGDQEKGRFTLNQEEEETTIELTDKDTTYELASEDADGLLRQLDGDSTHFMRGDGTWATPPDTKYELPVAGEALGGIKQGGDITIAEDGVVTVNDNSHHHAIKDVTSLQDKLDSKIDSSKMGVENGVATLDGSGRVPTTQLPSYVDDVIEGYLIINIFYKDKTYQEQIQPEEGKIYVDMETNKTYRWSGSGYTEISASLALGVTSSTAFQGDHGDVAYKHALAHGEEHAEGLYKITTNAEGHVSAATEVTRDDIVSLGIPGTDTKYNDFSGATELGDGAQGLVPAPKTNDNVNKYLKADGNWSAVTASEVAFSDGQTFQEKLDTGDLKGDTGAAGPAGARGEAGPAGPNIVSSTTESDLTGLLKGSEGKVVQAVAGEDYMLPSDKVNSAETADKVLHALQFSGASNAKFDGSVAVDVTIPATPKQWIVKISESGWGSSFPYKNTVSNITGVTADMDVRVLGLSIPESSNEATIKNLIKAAGCLITNENATGADSITFAAYERPTIDFSVIVEQDIHA